MRYSSDSLITQEEPHLPSLEAAKDTDKNDSTSAVSPPRQSGWHRQYRQRRGEGLMFPVKLSVFDGKGICDLLAHSLDKNEGTVPVNRVRMWRKTFHVRNRLKTCRYGTRDAIKGQIQTLHARNVTELVGNCPNEIVVG
jgi:hypothetical protein